MSARTIIFKILVVNLISIKFQIIYVVIVKDKIIRNMKLGIEILSHHLKLCNIDKIKEIICELLKDRMQRLRS